MANRIIDIQHSLDEEKWKDNLFVHLAPIFRKSWMIDIQYSIDEHFIRTGEEIKYIFIPFSNTANTIELAYKEATEINDLNEETKKAFEKSKKEAQKINKLNMERKKEIDDEMKENGGDSSGMLKVILGNMGFAYNEDDVYKYGRYEKLQKTTIEQITQRRKGGYVPYNHIQIHVGAQDGISHVYKEMQGGVTTYSETKEDYFSKCCNVIKQLHLEKYYSIDTVTKTIAIGKPKDSQKEDIKVKDIGKKDAKPKNLEKEVAELKKELKRIYANKANPEFLEFFCEEFDDTYSNTRKEKSEILRSIVVFEIEKNRLQVNEEARKKLKEIPFSETNPGAEIQEFFIKIDGIWRLVNNISTYQKYYEFYRTVADKDKQEILRRYIIDLYKYFFLGFTLSGKKNLAEKTNTQPSIFLLVKKFIQAETNKVFQEWQNLGFFKIKDHHKKGGIEYYENSLDKEGLINQLRHTIQEGRGTAMANIHKHIKSNAKMKVFILGPKGWNEF